MKHLTNQLKKTLITLLLLCLLIMIIGGCQQTKKGNSSVQFPAPTFTQIVTDSLFDSKQIISLLEVKKASLEKYKFEIWPGSGKLTTTSSIGKKEDAFAAVNGSFFNMETGESVTYSEANDTVISQTSIREKRAYLVDGAVVVKDDGQVFIEPTSQEKDEFYLESTKERGVLVSGPLLIVDSKLTKLPNDPFITKRHPRTCLCIKEKSIVFITIDGRQEKAMGMNLHEVQTFLKGLNCKDALNLDGGGSTTLWTKKKGIVNFPSDKTGERPVSNALLILEKN